MWCQSPPKPLVLLGHFVYSLWFLFGISFVLKEIRNLIKYPISRTEFEFLIIPLVSFHSNKSTRLHQSEAFLFQGGHWCEQMWVAEPMWLHIQSYTAWLTNISHTLWPLSLNKCLFTWQDNKKLWNVYDPKAHPGAQIRKKTTTTTLLALSWEGCLQGFST